MDNLKAPPPPQTPEALIAEVRKRQLTAEDFKEADTNRDGKPDVAIAYDPSGQPIYQDEDVDFDGVVDRRFRGDQPADVPPGTAIPGEPFGRLDCGAFHSFWWKR